MPQPHEGTRAASKSLHSLAPRSSHEDGATLWQGDCDMGEKASNRRRLRRLPWLLAALALLTGGAAAGLYLGGCNDAGVQTVTAESGDVERLIAAFGPLEPKHHVDGGTQATR